MVTKVLNTNMRLKSQMMHEYLKINASLDSIKQKVYNKLEQDEITENSQSSSSVNVKPDQITDYKPLLDKIYPQYSVCGTIKESSLQSLYCKDNYKLSIDKNIICITAFCEDCCDKYAPEIEIKDCQKECDSKHSKNAKKIDYELELSKICSKEEVVLRNIDFCRIMESASPADYSAEKCFGKLCTDCCDKELKSHSNTDLYYKNCNTNCIDQSKILEKEAKKDNKFEIIDINSDQNDKHKKSNIHDLKKSIKFEMNPVRENIVQGLKSEVLKYEDKLNRKLDVNYSIDNIYKKFDSADNQKSSMSDSLRNKQNNVKTPLESKMKSKDISNPNSSTPIITPVSTNTTNNTLDFTKLNPNRILAKMSEKICNYDQKRHLNLCSKTDSHSKCINVYCDTCCLNVQTMTNDFNIYNSCYDKCAKDKIYNINMLGALYNSIFDACVENQNESDNIFCKTSKCEDLCSYKSIQNLKPKAECLSECSNYVERKNKLLILYTKQKAAELSLNKDSNKNEIENENEKKTSIFSSNILDSSDKSNLKNVNQNDKLIKNIKYDQLNDFDLNKIFDYERDSSKMVSDDNMEELKKLSDEEFSNKIGLMEAKTSVLKSRLTTIEKSMLDKYKTRNNKYETYNGDYNSIDLQDYS